MSETDEKNYNMDLKDKKTIESIQSIYNILTTLELEGHDITDNPYWKNNPYFSNIQQMRSFLHAYRFMQIHQYIYNKIKIE